MNNQVVGSNRHSNQDQFKEKYSILRAAYDKRIKDLAAVVSEACQNLSHDEIIGELKRDPVGMTFIPHHITELFTNHLQSERERYIHELVDKLSSLQVEVENLKKTTLITNLTAKVGTLEPEVVQLRRTTLAVDPLKERLMKLQAEFEAVAAKSDDEVSALIEDRNRWKKNAEDMITHNRNLDTSQEKSLASMQSMQLELDKMRANNSNLIHTIELSSQEISALTTSNNDKNTRIIELQGILAKQGDENKLLLENLQEVQTNYKLSCQELQQTQELLRKKGMEENECTSKLTTMMAQIEEILLVESQESSEAISTVHEKMKLLRHRFIIELQKEKRLVAALQNELLDARRSRDEAGKDMHIASSEITTMRTEQKRDKDLITLLQSDLTKVQSKLTDKESKLLRAEERIIELDKNRDRDWKLLEQKLRLEFQESLQREQSDSKLKESSLKLKYETDISLLQQSQQLRASYSNDASILGYHQQSLSHQYYPPPTTTTTTTIAADGQAFYQKHDMDNVFGCGVNDSSQFDRRSFSLPAVDNRMIPVAIMDQISHERDQLEQQTIQLKGKLAEASEHIATLRGMVVALQQFKKHHEKQSLSFVDDETNVSSTRNTSNAKSSSTSSVHVGSESMNLNNVSIPIRTAATPSTFNKRQTQQQQTHSVPHRYQKIQQSSIDLEIEDADAENDDNNNAGDNGRYESEHSHDDESMSSRRVGVNSDIKAIGRRSNANTGAISFDESFKSSTSKLKQGGTIGTPVDAPIIHELQQAKQENKRLSDDIKKLTVLLQETKERALHDQERDTIALHDMRNKFSSLMGKYETAIAAMSNRETLSEMPAATTIAASADSATNASSVSRSSHVTSAQKGVELFEKSIDVDEKAQWAAANSQLKSKLEMLQILETNLEKKLQQTGDLEKLLEKEQLKNRRINQRVKSLETTLLSVDQLYKQQIRAFRYSLQTIREEIVEFQSRIIPNKAMQEEKYIEMVSLYQYEIVQQCNKKMLQDRIDSTNAFNAEKTALITAFEDKIASIQMQCDEKISHLRNEIILEASRTGTTHQSFIADSTFNNLSFHPTQSGSKSEAKDVILSSKPVSQNLSVAAFESVLNGMLEAMTDQQFIAIGVSARIIAAAKDHQEPSFAAAAVAKALIFDALDTVYAQLHDAQMQNVVGSHLRQDNDDADTENSRVNRIVALEADIIHQRQQHAEETIAWNNERQQLLQKIRELKDRGIPIALSTAMSDNSSIKSALSMPNWADTTAVELPGTSVIASEDGQGNNIAAGKGNLKLEKEKRRRLQSEMLEQQQKHQQQIDSLQRQLRDFQTRAETAELTAVSLKMQAK